MTNGDKKKKGRKTIKTNSAIRAAAIGSMGKDAVKSAEKLMTGRISKPLAPTPKPRR
tara:strand:+ start:6548 stop:6718 length:171 start_codon:yes stop_codon:yes gene_type:complete